MKIKAWWVKLAIQKVVVPVVRKNAAAAAVLVTLANDGSWVDLVKTLARLFPVGSYTEAIEKPALPHLRAAVDKYDGPGDVGVVVLDALTEPFKGGEIQ